MKTEPLLFTVNKNLVGQRVVMHVGGMGCTRDYDGCSGIIVGTSGINISVSIDKGYGRGRTLGFHVGENYWGYTLELTDWDN